MARDAELKTRWQKSWPLALECWSTFTKLSEPRWCVTPEEEAKEGLSCSFAMIRLVDHGVVISLRQVAEQNVEEFSLQILAHEVGHHVYAPGDLQDNAKLLAAVRAGLPGREYQAGLVANLFTDLLINDRLQRKMGLDMAAVYERLRHPSESGLWSFYMHTYEVLWGLSPMTLFDGPFTDQIRGDALLAARLIRNFSGHWLSGAGQFAVLCLDYLEKDEDPPEPLRYWLDAVLAGAGAEVPEGLTALSKEEGEGVAHPALEGATDGQERAVVGGVKNQYRSPRQYVELMQSLGVEVDEQDLIMKYYRELARPHAMPFPTTTRIPSKEPLIEGTRPWHPGSPLAAIDWIATALQSPVIVPGVTTLERVTGTSTGDDPETMPVDLYLGIDCSGSMLNPSFGLSYPVVAGTVLLLSALRAGAKAKTVLSGEPGRYAQTPGYSTSLNENLRVLTSYLGSGYAFGLSRLDEDFVQAAPLKRPVHVVIVTDSDIFTMLEQYPDGWEVARKTVEKAGAGVSCVLEYDIENSYYAKEYERLQSLGWTLYSVRDQSELVAFAREFSRRTFGKTGGRR